jgi:hypothetical protein
MLFKKEWQWRHVCAGCGSLAQVTLYTFLEIEEITSGEPNKKPDAEYSA